MKRKKPGRGKDARRGKPAKHGGRGQHRRRAKPRPPAASKKSSALLVEDLVKILKQAGAKELTPAALRADLAAGAPANKDGTVSIVHYTAWLVAQVGK